MKNPAFDTGRRRSALPALAADLDRDAAEARADAEHYARVGNTGMYAATLAVVDACEKAAAKARDEYGRLTTGPRKV